MKFVKTFIISLFCFFLLNCSSGASYNQQQEVKVEVLKLLEREYKQPFKLEKFKYEYKTHYPNASGNVPYETFGTYYFKVQAVNNPIVVMDFRINDGLATKDSINGLIESFKKTQLKDLYCLGLAQHYVNEKKLLTDKLTKQELQANEYCDSIGQKKVYDNAWTR
ncbi:hypothetical protein [Francisella philomiragia]|uniref:Putative lipoprotein n=1 Tax=Francisella philomiragia TaxID=28110 RepID=A0A0B6D3N3_9GAMM|nr:hypothetical protein [Francisella philomiragia]AJI53451.1 putative lipoprotein [Francisella philomiragia]